jgi:UDP-glucuronate 4-epimerase
VPNTYVDVDDLVEEFGYKPSMNVKQGVENFAAWYKEYNEQ